MEKQALGMSMQISQDFIDNLARELVSESLMKTLGGSDLFVEQLIRELLGTKVDPRDGSPTTYRDGVSWLKWATDNIIKEEVKKVILEIMEEKRPQIHDAIREELLKKSTTDAMCESFMDSITRNLDYAWMTKIDVKFEKRGD